MNKYIGIDVSKKDFYACTREAGLPMLFSNDKLGIKKLADQLEKESCFKEDTIIGVESTGIYHLPLSLGLTQYGFTVKVINPLITKKANQATIRKVKNDRKDAGVVRHCAANGQGYEFIDTKESQG